MPCFNPGFISEIPGCPSSLFTLNFRQTPWWLLPYVPQIAEFSQFSIKQLTNHSEVVSLILDVKNSSGKSMQSRVQFLDSPILDLA